MKICSLSTKLFLGFILFLHASFSMASSAIGPAATVALNFGSSQAAPRIGLGLGLYSVASPTETRMAPMFSLMLGGHHRNQQNIYANAMSAAPTRSADKEAGTNHTFLYVTGAVAVVAVGALLLTARHNAPPTQGSGGSNPPVQ